MSGRLRIDAKMLGTAEVRREIEKAGHKYPQAVDRAVYQMGMVVWGSAVRKAPVEFGVLRTSAYVAPPQGTPGAASVEVGFGTNYAIFQHEGANLQHPRGGEAGFLRKAVEQEVSAERIAAFVRSNIASGKGTVAVPPGVGRRPPTAPVVRDSERERRATSRKERRQKRRENK